MAGQTIGKVVAGGKTHTITSTFYGTCATAAATAAKEVIINETNTTEALSFISGMTLTVKFVYSNTVANPTLTCFNNSGSTTAPTKGSTTLLTAKSIYRLNPNLNSAGTAVSTSAATSWTAGAIVTFVYDGVGWVETSSWDNNTTYANYSFGNGYGTCATAAATAAKVATYTNYALVNHGIVSIKFTYANTAASPTLNINSRGAKAIWYHGAVVSTDCKVWGPGDIVTFIYNTIDNSTGVYEIISIDKEHSIEISTSENNPDYSQQKIWIEI